MVSRDRCLDLSPQGLLKCPVYICPAMNTMMWDNPFTREHLKVVFCGESRIRSHLGQPCRVPLSSYHSFPDSHQVCLSMMGFRLIMPISKTLVCGDTGLGAMAEPRDIAAAVLEGRSGDSLPQSWSENHSLTPGLGISLAANAALLCLLLYRIPFQ